MTSVHEFELRIAGFNRKLQFEWEQSRWKVWQLLTPHFKKGRAPQSAQAFCRFPWEMAQNNMDDMQESLERCHVTAAEAAALNALFNKNKKKSVNHG